MQRRLGVLVVGAGSIGERHLRCLIDTGRCDVAVCEPRDAVRARIAETYGTANAFASTDEALSGGFDSVVIATPAPTHIQLARQAVGAGMAALIEKPLAVSEAGVTELIEEARAQGLATGVAYVYRAHPALRAMRDAIAAGRFGAPLQLVAVSGQHFPTYRPAFASTYYASHADGGGAIQDALTHIFNAAEWLVGPITRIAADAAHLKLPGVEVEDTVQAIARHGDVLASYSLNQHQAPNEMMLTVICERGTVRFDLLKHAWRWMVDPETPWQEEAADIPSRDAWFTAQEHAWLDTVERKTPPLCSLEEGLQTLRVNLAALASVRQSGAWVTVAPNERKAVAHA